MTLRERPVAALVARRVVLVIVDGLRPEAIEQFGLANLRRVANRGASTLTARSVTPPHTTTCVASLMMGVSPAAHGVRTERLTFPRNVSRIDTLPRSIATAGFPVSGFMGDIPATVRGTAALLGRELGFQSLSFTGQTSADILSSVVHSLCTQRRGLIALHFPDADRAGHEHGWMSDSYGAATRAIDQSIGILDALSGAAGGETLLVIAADHGGGGVDPRNHMGDHSLDLTVPLLLSGRHIARCTLGDVSLLDIPPTILAALGIAVPRSYEGRVLTEAFETILAPARAWA